MSDQIKTEQLNEAHISPSELNAGLGNERIKRCIHENSNYSYKVVTECFITATC